MKNKPYRKTLIAAFIGFISQSIIVNFAPLLFVTFSITFNIPIEKITFLVIANFGIQLLTDLAASRFTNKIGYRQLLLLAHLMCGGGLIMMALLPGIIEPFTALILSTIVYAVGGGLLEVILNPVVEACPVDNKEGLMSVFHSFYCWGTVGVVILSTLFFATVGIEKWRILSCLWAVIPLANTISFIYVPLYSVAEKSKDKANYKELFSQKTFWLIMIIMFCAGAAELTVGQWASTFVEEGFGVAKSYGDLIGVCGFAICMGLARILHGKYSSKIRIETAIFVMSILCIISYLLIGLAKSDILGLIGCVLCGFSVGIFWPGTISMAARKVKNGGTTMYALCALGGDVGCTTGPALAGFMTGVLNDNLRLGILCSVIFPVIMLLGIVFLRDRKH